MRKQFVLLCVGILTVSGAGTITGAALDAEQKKHSVISWSLAGVSPEMFMNWFESVQAYATMPQSVPQPDIRPLPLSRLYKQIKSLENIWKQRVLSRKVDVAALFSLTCGWEDEQLSRFWKVLYKRAGEYGQKHSKKLDDLVSSCAKVNGELGRDYHPDDLSKARAVREAQCSVAYVLLNVCIMPYLFAPKKVE